jgi:hypothetical protein
VLVVTDKQERQRSEDWQRDQRRQDREMCHELFTTEDTENTEVQIDCQRNRSSVTSVTSVVKFFYRHR